jgi:hypothetical protein
MYAYEPPKYEQAVRYWFLYFSCPTILRPTYNSNLYFQAPFRLIKSPTSTQRAVVFETMKKNYTVF